MRLSFRQQNIIIDLLNKLPSENLAEESCKTALKKGAEKVFNSLGVTLNDGIRMFLNQVMIEPIALAKHEVT